MPICLQDRVRHRKVLKAARIYSSLMCAVVSFQGKLKISFQPQRLGETLRRGHCEGLCSSPLASRTSEPFEEQLLTKLSTNNCASFIPREELGVGALSTGTLDNRLLSKSGNSTAPRTGCPR